MIHKYLLPGLAGGMMLFAVIYVASAHPAQDQAKPSSPPASTPFIRTVAGAGIVEAQTENIAVGSALPGIVTDVYVKVGQKVKAQEPLFRLDDRQLQAEFKYREANLAAARAQLLRLENLPRPEEIPAAEARVAEAQANLADQQDQLNRTRRLSTTRAVADEEMNRRQQAYNATREQFNRARDDLALLKAGAWEPDKAIARAAVEQAASQLEQTKTDLDRLIVRALVDGEVLQVNVRPGEFVGAPPGQALIVLGNVHKLHVRVDIDEHDIPRFRPGASARATLRGDPQHPFNLQFVRVEPYVIPKKSLTGDNTERVDTRVLQVIYVVDPGSRTLYVGQQLDVFVDIANTTASAGGSPNELNY